LFVDYTLYSLYRRKVLVRVGREPQPIRFQLTEGIQLPLVKWLPPPFEKRFVVAEATRTPPAYESRIECADI
jgi:hypothetical protein